MPTTYQSWSVVFGEQPSAAKWNILGTNDAGFNNGTALPVGTCVQIATTQYTTVATGTTLIPVDNSIPQIGEGNEYMTQAITPRSATNRLVIEANAFTSNTQAGGAWHSMALFQDATSNALAATTQYQATANGAASNKLAYSMIAGTTSSTTFRIRIGANVAGTTTFGGASSATLFGAIAHSAIVIREYTV